MAQVLDYSAGKPGALAIVRAGYKGAVRYIGLPGRTKDTDRAEYEDFSRNGIGMALVFEEAAGNWSRGRSQGVIDGRRARDHANAIGFPADRPIYMAVDQDVVAAGQFAAMLDYLRGASESLGGTYVTGVYGEADVIDRARDARVAAWFWQTKAWSRGRVTSAHLLQLIGTVNVGGIGCDINDVLATDWGQHNARSDMEPNTPIGQYYWVPAGQPPVRRDAGEAWANAESYGKTTAEVSARIEAKLDALTRTLSDDEANIIAVVRAGGVDAATFAASLAPILAPLIPAGITKEDARAAALDAIELAFSRGAGQ